MPAISKDKKQYPVSRVRSVLAPDHQIALDDLALRLDREYGVKIERHYLSQQDLCRTSEARRPPDPQLCPCGIRGRQDAGGPGMRRETP